jgi:hypothetical protein
LLRRPDKSGRDRNDGWDCPLESEFAQRTALRSLIFNSKDSVKKIFASFALKMPLDSFF